MKNYIYIFSKAILLIAITFVLSSKLFDPLGDPDLWWHISIGRWILHNQTVPEIDLWNAFSEGKVFRAYSWSFEIIVAYVEKNFGLNGLFILKTITAFTISASFLFCFFQLSKNFLISLFLSAICLAPIKLFFALRPQSLTWVFFICILVLADKIKKQKTPSLKYIIYIFFLSSLWANTHLTLSLGIAASCLWAFDLKKIRPSITIFSAAMVGSLFTPYLGGEWITLLNKTSHPFVHSYITEFQPANIKQQFSLILLVLILFLFGCLLQKKQKISSFQLIGLGFFSLIGLSTVKFMPYPLIYICVLLTQINIKFFSKERSKLFETTQPYKKLKYSLISALLVLAVFNKSKLLMSSHSILLNKKNLPVEAIDFAIQNKLAHPILHGFSESGYFMYRFTDKKGVIKNKVAIDGRTNINNEKVIAEFVHALLADSKWEDVFSRIKPKTVIWETELGLSSILHQTNKWKKVFPNDDTYNRWSVFIKQKSQYPPLNSSK